MGDDSRWRHRSPTTDAELWEYLRWRLGLGDYDDHADSRPWWKYRSGEIAKVTSTRRKRRASIAELVRTAEYCHAHRIPILNQVWLYKHIADANRLAAEQRREVGSDLTQLIASAIASEQALADEMSPMWIGRLTRSMGPYRKEVLDEWQQARQSPSSRSHG